MSQQSNEPLDDTIIARSFDDTFHDTQQLVNQIP